MLFFSSVLSLSMFLGSSYSLTIFGLSFFLNFFILPVNFLYIFILFTLVILGDNGRIAQIIAILQNDQWFITILKLKLEFKTKIIIVLLGNSSFIQNSHRVCCVIRIS